MRDLKNEFADSADSWKLRSQELRFGRTPVLMGILNVTPDSFSDGGKFVDINAAVDQALRMIDEGAEIIDVGGESTRPYSTPVSTQEEIERTVRVVAALAEQTATPISIDTSKSLVARECILAGAEIINDVTGLESDSEMINVARETGAGVCAMHMQGNPQNMQDNPAYQNVTEDIFQYLLNRRDRLIASGISREKICLDPGIGFGKTHRHNLELVANCGRFHELDCPLLVGHSRKGFIAKILNDKDCDRTAATAGVAIELARQAIQVIRVHDVKVVRDAIELFAAVGGIDGQIAEVE